MNDRSLFPLHIRRDGSGFIAEMRQIEASEFQDPFVEETVRRVAGLNVLQPIGGCRRGMAA